MPLYVYSCPDCDVLLEELRPVGMANWPPVECPVCHTLCHQEPTSVSRIGGSSPLDRDFERHRDPGQPEPDPVAVMHGPGCPCCRTV